jgi:hypothetical protein
VLDYSYKKEHFHCTVPNQRLLRSVLRQCHPFRCYCSQSEAAALCPASMSSISLLLSRHFGGATVVPRCSCCQYPPYECGVGYRDISPVRGRDFPRHAKDDSGPRTSRAGKGEQPSQRLVPRTGSTHCGCACPSRYERSQE